MRAEPQKTYRTSRSTFQAEHTASICSLPDGPFLQIIGGLETNDVASFAGVSRRLEEIALQVTEAQIPFNATPTSIEQFLWRRTSIGDIHVRSNEIFQRRSHEATLHSWAQKLPKLKSLNVFMVDDAPRSKMLSSFSSCFALLEHLKLSGRDIHPTVKPIESASFPHLKHLLIDSFSVNASDIPSILQGCPSLTMIDTFLSGDQLTLEHSKLETAILFFQGPHIADLTLKTPALTTLHTDSVRSAAGEVSPVLESLDLGESNTLVNLDLSPVASQLVSLQFCHQVSPQVLLALADMVEASRSTLRRVAMHSDAEGSAGASRSDNSFFVTVWMQIQKCPNLEDLSFTVDKVPLPALDFTKLLRLTELQMEVEDTESFLDAWNKTSKAGEKVIWKYFAKHVGSRCNALSSLCVYFLTDNLYKGNLENLFHGVKELPHVNVAFK